MTASEWVGPSTSIATVVLGAAAGWLTSELRLRRDRREVSDRQRLQIHLATTELLASLMQIDAGAHGLAFLNEALVYVQLQRPSAWDRREPYYLKYDLVDAVYRLCALLGWMEVYRSDATFLAGAQADRARLERGFAALRGGLADVRAPQREGDAPAGRTPASAASAFILEDDQRAIGEQMADSTRPAMVIGYAAFCERLFRLPPQDDPVGTGDTAQNHWVWNATLFVLDFARMPADRGSRAADDPHQARLTRVIAELRALADATRSS